MIRCRAVVVPEPGGGVVATVLETGEEVVGASVEDALQLLAGVRLARQGAVASLEAFRLYDRLVLMSAEERARQGVEVVDLRLADDGETVVVERRRRGFSYPPSRPSA